MGLPPSYALLIEYAQQIVTGRGSTENTIIKRLGRKTVCTAADDNLDRNTLSAKEMMTENSGAYRERSQVFRPQKLSAGPSVWGHTLAALRVPLSVIGSLSDQPYPINPPLMDKARGYPVCLNFLLSQHFRSNVQWTQVSPQLLYTPS